eukprot:m.312691 g.312691  ORF g.312691 m.312691 type:complete len:90 (+) comp19660_c1_seq3:2100-2369(+)
MLESVLINTKLNATRFEAAVMQYVVTPLSADKLEATICADAHLAKLLLLHTLIIEQVKVGTLASIADVESIAQAVLEKADLTEAEKSLP